MRMTIYKYPLLRSSLNSILMPEGAEILTVQMQDKMPCLWALADQDQSPVYRNIEIFGTGDFMPEEKRHYIGTFQVSVYVWHVFERLTNDLERA